MFREHPERSLRSRSQDEQLSDEAQSASQAGSDASFTLQWCGGGTPSLAEEGSTLAPSAIHLLPSAFLGSVTGQGCKWAFRLHQSALKPGSYSQEIPSQVKLPLLAHPQSELVRVPLKPFLLNFTPKSSGGRMLAGF